MLFDNFPAQNWFTWFEDQENFATITGSSDEAATSLILDQRIPNDSEVIQLTTVDYGPKVVSDFPGTGARYPKILSERAYDVLHDALDENGIQRQAEINGNRYFLFWPRTISTSLDYERSKIKCSPTGYQRLEVPVFRSDFSEDRAVFVTKEFPSLLFVSRDFIERIKDNALSGFCTWHDMSDDTTLEYVVSSEAPKK